MLQILAKENITTRAFQFPVGLVNPLPIAEYTIVIGSAETIPAPVDQRVGFKACCLQSGKYDGELRNHYFREWAIICSMNYLTGQVSASPFVPSTNSTMNRKVYQRSFISSRVNLRPPLEYLSCNSLMQANAWFACDLFWQISLSQSQKRLMVVLT